MLNKSDLTDEIGLWQALIESQEQYVRSLACLDEMALSSLQSTVLDEGLIQKAGERRRATYARYREAMHQIAEYHANIQ
jgi:hypothetical protein